MADKDHAWSEVSFICNCVISFKAVCNNKDNYMFAIERLSQAIGNWFVTTKTIIFCNQNIARQLAIGNWFETTKTIIFCNQNIAKQLAIGL